VRFRGRAVVLVLAVLVAACSGFIREAWVGTLRPGEIAVPVASWRLADGSTLLCAGGGWPDLPTLHGSPDDPRVVWVSRNGARVDVAWPNGWRARFTPTLELLDSDDNVVAVEGSSISGGCGTAEPNVYSVDLARR
jgi:hypothetical protein